MKKILAATAVLAMIMALTAIPASAAGLTSQTTANTAVTISQGGGDPPFIKVKWEQDTDFSISGMATEDGDPLHLIPGSQFNPPCLYQGNKTIYYYAIVNDTEDGGDVAQVWADVNHPSDSWEKGSFKYEIPFSKFTDASPSQQAEVAAFQAAFDANLITINAGTSYNDIIYELQKGTARLWIGKADLYYEQPAGNYTVTVGAQDHNNNNALGLGNVFTYLPAKCFAIDNSAVNYGAVQISTAKKIPGDANFLPNDGKMTARNLANQNITLKINQDDMGFGKDINGKYNVQFDARLGMVSYSALYDPFVWTHIPGMLPHSTDDELDFSIHVYKATAQSYTGSMTITADTASTAPGQPLP